MTSELHRVGHIFSTGQTNITSHLCGSGTVDGQGKDWGRFIVTTMEIPWQLVGPRLGARPIAVIMTESMEETWFENQVAQAPECDTVVAVGGGQAIDFGKYLAWRLGVRLVTIPTVISVNAFATPKAAVRRQHQVDYVGDTSPNPLIIDYDLIRTAPSQLNIAGVGDILSIHTATFDWETAHRAGRDTHGFSAADVQKARDILKSIENNVDAIRSNTDIGLQTLIDAYLRINSICLPVDHFRTEEGSEHFVFYELEERLGRNFIHGHIVGLGIYLMSRLQDNDAARITDLMDRLDLHYNPVHLQLDRTTLADSLANLQSYCHQRGLWYSAAHEREASRAWIDDALNGLCF
jgi:glycerol-1-phosphate dehydrogenase [NAD(P)+]